MTNARVNNPTQVSNRFQKQYAYLFLVDIDRLASGEGFPEYEKREKGYGKALLKAYQYAFSQDIKRQLSEELIQNINRIGISHLPAETPGQYKTGGNFFTVGLPVVNISENEQARAANPNATLEGFWQFANNWLINKKKPIHFVHLESASAELYFTPVNGFGKVGLWVQILQNGRLVHLAAYSDEDKKFIETLFKNASFKCYINSTSPNILPSLGLKEPINEIVSKELKDICDRYNSAILTATTDDEKIKIIVDHVQLISQLHPFKDGNIRTIYVLLNRLLHEEKLSLSILINPNRFDCFTVQQLVVMVKEGQRCFMALVNNEMPMFRDEYLLHTPDLKAFDLPDLDEELSAFIDILLNNIKKPSTYDPTLFGQFEPRPSGTVTGENVAATAARR